MTLFLFSFVLKSFPPICDCDKHWWVAPLLKLVTRNFKRVWWKCLNLTADSKRQKKKKRYQMACVTVIYWQLEITWRNECACERDFTLECIGQMCMCVSCVCKICTIHTYRWWHLSRKIKIGLQSIAVKRILDCRRCTYSDKRKVNSCGAIYKPS